MRKFLSAILATAVLAVTSFALILPEQKRTISETASVAKVVKTNAVEVAVTSSAFLDTTAMPDAAPASNIFRTDRAVYEQKYAHRSVPYVMRA